LHWHTLDSLLNGLGSLGHGPLLIVVGIGLDVALAETAILERDELLLSLGKLSLELLVGQLSSLFDRRCGLGNGALDLEVGLHGFGPVLLIGRLLRRVVRGWCGGGRRVIPSARRRVSARNVGSIVGAVSDGLLIGSGNWSVRRIGGASRQPVDSNFALYKRGLIRRLELIDG
jgi:hypothetical protein